MEKLQAALQKARESRGETRPLAENDQNLTGRRPEQSSSVDDRWNALKEIDVDKYQMEKQRLVTQVANSKGTPFDILKTKVLLQMRENGWKRLAITSPMPDSGKTTTACNLALSLGRQADFRSMLLDFDLRDPSVDAFLDR